MAKLEVSELRRNSRNPDFCSTVSSEFLDKIIASLHANSNDFEGTTDLIASISNILLINRNLYKDYFRQKYSSDTLQFLLSFIELQVPNDTPETEFSSLVALYRLFFLILYDLEAGEELLNKSSNVLISKFYDSTRLYVTFWHVNSFQMMFIEILKSLYALFHNNPKVDKPKHFHVRCVSMLNYIFREESNVFSEKELTMGKNLINLLLVLKNEYKFDEATIEIYSKFYKNLCTLLEYYLENISKNHEYETNDLIQILAITNVQLTYLNSHSKNIGIKDLRHVFIDRILPTNKSNIIYSFLLNILMRSKSLHFDNFFENPESAYLRNLILECFFKLSWSEDEQEQIVKFLELVGFILGKSFIESNQLHIGESIELNDYLKPKHFNEDFDKVNDKNLSKFFQNFPKNKQEPLEKFTEEEKMEEAEKLFVLMDRMEKTGVFQDFKNPVREWQQSGKFEDLDKN